MLFELLAHCVSVIRRGGAHHRPHRQQALEIPSTFRAFSKFFFFEHKLVSKKKLHPNVVALFPSEPLPPPACLPGSPSPLQVAPRLVWLNVPWENEKIGGEGMLPPKGFQLNSRAFQTTPQHGSRAHTVNPEGGFR